MNIDTSSSVSSTANTSGSSSSSKPSKGSEGSSFDEELKNASTSEEVKVENKDETVATKPDVSGEKDDNHHLNKDIVPAIAIEGMVDFTDFKYHNESKSLLAKNIQDLINTRGMIAMERKVSSDGVTGMASGYNSMEMSDGDALFFSNLVKSTDMSMQSIATQVQMEAESNVQAAVKSANVSTVLMDKLNESMKTNQPFRIDFDKDISVIIKVDKNGSITASFIPGDKAVEQYLKNNISFLKQRFDEENLSYNELSYSHERHQQQQEKRKNKENGHE